MGIPEFAWNGDLGVSEAPPEITLRNHKAVKQGVMLGQGTVGASIIATTICPCAFQSRYTAS